MAVVYISKISNWIEKIFNVKGSPAILDIEQAARVVLPWPIGNEERVTQGWNRYTFATQQPAVAAQFSALQIRNPPGSNILAVLERVMIFESVADSVNLSRSFSQLTDLATVNTGAGAVDSRSTRASGLITSRTTLVAVTDLGTGAQAGVMNAANQVFDYILTVNQEYPLLPSMAYRVCAQVANSTLTVSWMWRERALDQSELT